MTWCVFLLPNSVSNKLTPLITKPCLGTAVDECKAELRVESDGLWHCPDGKGHGANVLNHAGCL